MHYLSILTVRKSIFRVLKFPSSGVFAHLAKSEDYHLPKHIHYNPPSYGYHDDKRYSKPFSRSTSGSSPKSNSLLLKETL